MYQVGEPSIIINNDDVTSVCSYDSLAGRDSGDSPAPRSMKVDGKVPDVLYVLNHLGWNNKLLNSRQSDSPFKDVHHIRDNDSEDCPDKPEDLPVLEIVTSVHTRGLPVQRRGVRPRQPVQVSKPITTAVNDVIPYHEDYYDQDDRFYDRPTYEVMSPFMIIHSQHLINALRAVVSYYPHFALNDEMVKIDAPYRALYHYRKELADYRDYQPWKHSAEYAKTTSDHIDILLKFLEENKVGTSIRQEQERHQLDTPAASFEYYWLLLKPGEIIYAKRHDIWTSFVVSSIEGGVDRAGQHVNYIVNCWFLESNGVKVERFMESFVVSPWLGEQAIGGLPVVPAAFWVEDFEAQGGQRMRVKQIEEGKMYWDLLQRPVYMEYDGLLVNSRSNGSATGQTGFMCGRVICDAAGFDKYGRVAPDTVYDRRIRCSPNYRAPQALPPHKDYLPQSLPHCECTACMQGQPITRRGPFHGFEDLDPLTDSPPCNDLFYLVCSSVVPGFILGTRKWGNLHIANLNPVQSDKEAFKYLVLDDDIKMTVKALIGKISTDATDQLVPWGNDFVKNKGEGRIFLLHGMPGVGKTCTAECIAELTNRPLISLTSGDLSVDSYDVEQNLNYFLELGKRYGALVLLDEADVYLESRRSKDISRNGLVSVFLRALEYYRGVLFLTTNRVQSFDRAFLSRIHVALHYKNLRDDDRQRIWAHNFDRVGRDSREKVRVSMDARDFVYTSRQVRDLKWNGREIRNAMQTALALAETEAQDDNCDTITIGEKHMRAVVKMSKGFKDYIKKYSNFSDDDSDEESAPLSRPVSPFYASE